MKNPLIRRNSPEHTTRILGGELGSTGADKLPDSGCDTRHLHQLVTAYQEGQLPLLPTKVVDAQWPREKRKKWKLFKLKQKKEIYEEQKGRCYLCKVYTHLDCDVMNDFHATIDHVIPKSWTHVWPKEYLESRKNLKIACRKCNMEKGNMSLNDYIKWKARKRNGN